MRVFSSVFLSKRFARFCSVGASGVIVNLGIFGILDALNTHRLLASIIAIECSILSNFAANELWTFRDRRVGNSWMHRLAQFQLISLIGALIQFTVFSLCFFLAAFSTQRQGDTSITFERFVNFVDDPPDLGYLMYVGQLLGIAAATGWNFAANLFWTWGRERAPSEGNE